MAAPVLIPCLVQLRTEFDEDCPGRGKASDGWIGDTAHQQETSDHNDDEVGNVPIHDGDHVHEVHAVDVDNNLDGKGPVSGARMALMEARVQFLLARCRSGAETRLRYIIYNRRIWKASNGWREEVYKGPSAHTEHAHFSASYESALEASTASWHLEDIAMPSAEEIAKAVWDYQLDNPYSKAKMPAGTILEYVPSRSPHELTQNMLTKLAAQFTAFATAEGADDAAKDRAMAGLREVVAALGPSIVSAVVAALPAGSVPLTQEQINEAFDHALHTAFSAA